LAELDTAVAAEQSVSEKWLKDVLAVGRECLREARRLDALGSAFMWLSGAYVAVEILAGMNGEIARAIRMILFNPLTTKAFKEALQNLALAERGFGKGAPAAIAATRDAVALGGTAPAISGSNRRRVEYQWWV
jgi:hypothetical protein